MSEKISEENEVREILQRDASDVPSELPILALDNFVLFPFMIAPVLVSDEVKIRMVDLAMRGSRVIGVFTQVKDEPSNEENESMEKAPPKSGFDSLPTIGAAAAVLKLLRLPDGSIRLLVHGLSRVRILERLSEAPFLKARIEVLEEVSPHNPETVAMVKSAQNMLQKVVSMSALPDDMAVAANNIDEAGKLADLIGSNLSFSLQEQQGILETVDAKKRLRNILQHLSQEAQVLEIGSRIQDEVKTRMDKSQRDYMLREQVKAIRRELGEDEDANPEIAELREAVAKAKLPAHARAAAEKELSRLEIMPPSAGEYGISRNYLDWILTLPWKRSTRDRIEIPRAERILDEDHYGLEKIKERILEYLAVVKLKKSLRGPILCFVGPPGVGKTSLGRSIARALDRKFFRMSLGGMRDEAEIQGHRRTYIGAMPGRIISGLKNCGSNNPVVMLDEIDKIGKDFRGDPASALLEVLDSEQNHSFSDHYLDLPFDLSKVMFITTANMLDTIPGPLRDRMEILTLSGYTHREKLQIAKRYLIPRSYEDNGVGPEHLVFQDGAVTRIIEDYTREAGLRNLEREIGNICRKIARRVAEGKQRKVIVKPDNVEDFLGRAKHYSKTAERPLESGVAVGLAWTPVGGEILFIEATESEGSGALTLTGQLGDVMRESAQAARSFLYANAQALGVPKTGFAKRGVHVHIPAGAIPKDGPSAGVAICTALASHLMGRRVREKVAMTGEITLKGAVLAVGGVKEKILAAHRAGIREIYLPARNEKDVEDIPSEVCDDIQFHFVERIEEVLNSVLEKASRPRRKTGAGRRAAKPSKPAKAKGKSTVKKARAAGNAV